MIRLNDHRPRFSPHYCRECGLYFEMNPELLTGSPHAEEYIHRFNKHYTLAAEYVSCSKQCEQRAQPEEITSGIRLYGKGAALPPTLKTFNQLFPEDKNDA